MEDRKIKLVVKGHECGRIGEIASWSSFDCVSRINDVGDAVLVAGWGASDANDAILDAMDTADVIIEAYIKPPEHDTFLEEPAWAGFLRDRKITQVGPVKVGQFLFKDYNHLLARRVLKPPGGASHVEEHDTTANVMRNLVRKHAGDEADSGRQFPGLRVEANDPGPEGQGLYGNLSAQVFGVNAPEWIRVNCLYEWHNHLYLGTESQSPEGTYAGIFRSSDGTTWEQVYDGSPGLYAEGITGIHCFAEFDEALWAGCSQDWETDGAVILRTVDGDDWTLAATFPNKAGIWTLQEFDGNFYAGTTGYQPYGSKVWLWSSADGFNWSDVQDVGDPWSGYFSGFAMCEAMHVWDGQLYVGALRFT